jgi:hypothetical protein
MVAEAAEPVPVLVTVRYDPEEAVAHVSVVVVPADVK